MPPRGPAYLTWDPGSHCSLLSSTAWALNFPGLPNSHDHQPLALLRQAHEGEEADEELQEQQKDIGQPPGGRRAEALSQLALESIEPRHPLPLPPGGSWDCRIPPAPSSPRDTEELWPAPTPPNNPSIWPAGRGGEECGRRGWRTGQELGCPCPVPPGQHTELHCGV
uniref:Uncharacterized protein n=1 Tax=Spermophilus dauricus TaxID=99837 RepID=A0A8C9PTJ8_SPEDA